MEAAAQGDCPSIDARFQAVLDAVFNQRLQEDAGHQNLQRVGIDMLFHLELGAEANDLDGQIIIGKSQLLA